VTAQIEKGKFRTLKPVGSDTLSKNPSATCLTRRNMFGNPTSRDYAYMRDVN